MTESLNELTSFFKIQIVLGGGVSFDSRSIRMAGACTLCKLSEGLL